MRLWSPFLPGSDSGSARKIEEPEYQVPSFPPPSSSTPATAVVTATNAAYAASSVSTSPNPAYQPVAQSREGGDIATETNVAYIASDITAAVNPAYRPMQTTSDNTSDRMYDYAKI